MPHKHGGDLVTYAARYGGHPPLDFSANINPLGIPQPVKNAVIAAVDSCDVYPDPYCRELRAAISEAEGVPAEQIFCSAGAADAIFRLAVAIKPQRALVTAPTFSEYEASLDAVGCETTHFALHESDGFAVTERILDAIDGVDAVYLCTPNNPTGMLTPLPLVLKIAEKCRDTGAVFVLDECFLDFTDEFERSTMKPFLQDFPNMVILRSFTKMFAIPGLRLGYCICSDTRLITRLYDSGAPWAVSGIAQACGVAALREQGFAEQTRELIKTQRIFLTTALRRLGFTVFDSAANFLLIKNHLPLDLCDTLAEHGFLVRSCANYVGLGREFYRTAIKSDAENKQLITALQSITSQHTKGDLR